MPHYTNWTGFKSDLSVRQRKAVNTLPKHTIHGMSPTKQIDTVRSWLEHDLGKAVFPKRSSLHDSVHCVNAIADELRINVKSVSFSNAIKKYNWKKPAKVWTTGPVTG